jgi:hypothetical protein
MVTQVMSGKNILQRNERTFYYLGNTFFSYEGINLHLPGIIENPQFISTGMVVMLEALLDFDVRLDPYIVWYNGRNKISEGKFSDGAGRLLWKAPEQSGFFSIRAEVFPVLSYGGLAGYQNEISLLVASKTMDIHLVSENIHQLVHWYTLNGNLDDSRMLTSVERSLKPGSNNAPQWIPANGSYGLATGVNHTFTLPEVPVSNINRLENVPVWQTLFRFRPVHDGRVFSVLFDSSSDTSINLDIEDQNLVLTLVTPLKTVSQVIRFPEKPSFLTAGVAFSVDSGLISAKINIIGNSVEPAAQPIVLEAEVSDSFQILLGMNQEDNAAVDIPHNQGRPLYTALWDEFALYNSPPMEIITAELSRAGRAGRPESIADSSN